MTTEKALSRLLTFGPAVIAAHARVRSRCILATAVGLDVLTRFEIAAVELPVTVRIVNARFVKAVEAGASIATAIATGGHLMVPAEGDEVDAKSWGGHLLLHLPGRALLADLDFQQFNRPARGLRFRDAELFDWPAGTQRREYVRGGGRVEIQATEDRTFERAPDWTEVERRAPLVAILCRAIRCGHL